MTARVLVIGLDGATFDVAGPLLAAGRLPNLARLRAEGLAAPLQSTFPPHSAPAWTSCRTGVQPGKHGIFGFWQRRGYEWHLVTSADIRVPAVEQILSRRGYRVCTVNVPLTYPPQPVNGAVVAGLPAPGPDSTFTYPAGLRAELRARAGDYVLDVATAPIEATEALRLEMVRWHHSHVAAARYLLARDAWDYAMVVLTLADKIQHRFWEFRERLLRGESGDDVQRAGPAIDQAYELLDEAVGLLLAAAGDEASVLVVSDHGFGPALQGAYPNVWLRQQGYLRLHPAHQIRARQVQWHRAMRLSIPRLILGAPGRRVSWRQTRAFGDLYVEPRGVWVNQKGRDPQGVVPPGRETERLLQELADGLQACEWPGGRPLFSPVRRPEEVYHGPHAGEAGDLLLAVSDPRVQLIGDFAGQDLVRPRLATQASGTHYPAGILVARGHRLAGASLPAAPCIVDVAPTILHLLGERVPGYMDGRLLCI